MVGPSAYKPTHTPPVLNIVDETVEYSYHRRVPNLDLNSMMYGESDDYAGDLNACVPAATANSITWMAQAYKHIELSKSMTLRKMMQELSGDFNRASSDGTPLENQLRGTLDFIERHGLPIEVKFQAFWEEDDIKSTSENSSARNLNIEEAKPPSWDFLKKMMLEGEDVTINYHWTENDTMYGHNVCVNAIAETKSNDYKRFAFKHDRFQDAEHGTCNEHYDVTIDPMGMMKFGPDNKYFVTSVVAKSPIPPRNGWFNEVHKNKKPGKALQAEVDFIELAFNEEIPDPENFRVTFYDGSDGSVYHTQSLSDFAQGAKTDSISTWLLAMSEIPLILDAGGMSLSYTGSVIPGQFLSYGGSFKAADGDAQGYSSVDIGSLTPGMSLGLNGTGKEYAHFTWSVRDTPTPGNLNHDQTVGEGSEVPARTEHSPGKFALYPCFPNPFNPSTRIRYEIAESRVCGNHGLQPSGTTD